MCLICLELQKGLLTPKEAMRNYREMVDYIPEAHAEELEETIQLAIFEEMLNEQ